MNGMHHLSCADQLPRLPCRLAVAHFLQHAMPTSGAVATCTCGCAAQAWSNMPWVPAGARRVHAAAAAAAHPLVEWVQSMGGLADGISVHAEGSQLGLGLKAAQVQSCAPLCCVPAASISSPGPEVISGCGALAGQLTIGVAADWLGIELYRQLQSISVCDLTPFAASKCRGTIHAPAGWLESRHHSTSSHAA